MKKLAILFLILWFGFAIVAEGQVIKGRRIVKAELLTDAEDFTKPFTAAIRLVIEPDWYTYWKNPGDSGLPIDVEWVLPAGWSADELKFPIPQKFVHDNMVTYGYKKEVVLFAVIDPTGLPRQSLKAKVDWMVCKESCVKGNAVVGLDLKKMDRGKRGQAKEILESFRKRLPQPRIAGTIEFKRAEADMEGADLRIQIPFKAGAGLELVDFYPESVKGILIDFSSIRLEGEKLVFSGTLEGTGTGDIYLSGLFIGADGKGYESSVPVKFNDIE